MPVTVDTIREELRARATRKATHLQGDLFDTERFAQKYYSVHGKKAGKEVKRVFSSEDLKTWLRKNPGFYTVYGFEDGKFLGSFPADSRNGRLRIN